MSKISKIFNAFFYAFSGPKNLLRYIYIQYSKLETLVNNDDSPIIQLMKKVPDYDYIFFQVEYQESVHSSMDIESVLYILHNVSLRIRWHLP